MTLLRPTPDETLDNLDSVEESIVAPAMSRAVRVFLDRLDDASQYALSQAATPQSIVAAGMLPPGADRVWPITGPMAEGWWADAVDAFVIEAVEQAWRRGYANTSDGRIISTSLDGMETYLAAVSDRLVEGLQPPLPDQAMDRVRVAVTTGAAQGWSTQQTAERIAADLSWEKQGSYWRAQRELADARIDELLDPLGPPGTPAREQARLTDPTVSAWQEQKATATRALDAESTTWQVRATRIARTESTGAFNAAGIAAMADEGVTEKVWVATFDARTRPSHLAANGQTVPIAEPFTVGAAQLMMPGDPSGFAEETVNCRCTTIDAAALL